jgi:hypothetical protein
MKNTGVFSYHEHHQKYYDIPLKHHILSNSRYRQENNHLNLDNFAGDLEHRINFAGF